VSAAARGGALRALAAAAVLACLAGCASAPPQPGQSTPPGKADAVQAVRARAAIDAADVVRLATAEYAGREHGAGRMGQKRHDEIIAACDVVLDAENVANGQLDTYLSTGHADALTALLAALESLATRQAQLVALKRGG
jgi:hypothetical protein